MMMTMQKYPEERKKANSSSKEEMKKGGGQPFDCSNLLVLQ
jgi:hypothetical protein